MTPEKAQAIYLDQMTRWGESITITQGEVSATVLGRRAKATKEDPLTDSVDQTALIYVVLADGLTFTPERGDRLTALDGTFMIAATSARRIATTLIAYELAVAG